MQHRSEVGSDRSNPVRSRAHPLQTRSTLNTRLRCLVLCLAVWMICGAGFGAGGCFGFAWGSRDSAFNATLLDMWEGGALLNASATQHSGVYVPAFILPIPLMAATESKACEELSQRIHDRLMRGGP